jgi:class 3 adenylate cyclase
MTGRETVTILFTDLAASTELSSRLVPEEADRVRQAHFSLLRQALAGNDGTEVKNLGDGLMAAFKTPSGRSGLCRCHATGRRPRQPTLG